MSKIKNWIEKYWKACLFVVGMIVTLTVSVMGWHWTETANKPFWWTFWVVAALLCIPGFIGLGVWFSKTRNKW